MLPLTITCWQKLGHAYGSAQDIPRLLKQLRADPLPRKHYTEEPWFSLWSSLCHQGDIYTASYAALPYLVDIACKTKGPIDFSFFLLPARIELARQHNRGPNVPPDLEKAYFHGLQRLGESVTLHQHDDWDQPMLLAAISALAVSKGHHKAADALMNLDDRWIERLIALDDAP